MFTCQVTSSVTFLIGVVLRQLMARVNNETTLVSTGGGSNSLRTTVPMWIIEQFKLTAGEKLSWKFDVNEDGELCVKVTPQQK